jgi:GAF domain-containing protein
VPLKARATVMGRWVGRARRTPTGAAAGGGGRHCGGPRARQADRGAGAAVSTLRTIDTAINASLDLNVTLNAAGAGAAAVGGARGGDFAMRALAASGFAAGAACAPPRPPAAAAGEGWAGVAARRTRVVADLAQVPPATLHGDVVQGEGFVAFVGVPLIAKGQLKGVFEIFHRAPLSAAADWLEFVETLAGQAAIAIDNATVYADLQRSHRSAPGL